MVHPSILRAKIRVERKQREARERSKAATAKARKLLARPPLTDRQRARHRVLSDDELRILWPIPDQVFGRSTKSMIMPTHCSPIPERRAF